jgi:hypothetical protein
MKCLLSTLAGLNESSERTKPILRPVGMPSKQAFIILDDRYNDTG